MSEVEEKAEKIPTVSPFKWAKDNDILLARELLDIEPYRYKPRSKESGKAWDAIADNLNAIKTPRFRVTQKSVRERAKLIIKNYQLATREIERASGIEVPEQSELDQALEEVVEKQATAKEELDLEEAIRQSEQDDKSKGEDMRLQAMERLSQTKKRKEEAGEESGSTSKKGKRSRRSGAETLDFMKEKMEKDQEIKKEEMELRRTEQRRMQEQQSTLLQQMQLQQVSQRQQVQDMLSAFMQQSQLQTQTMMGIVDKLMKQ